MAQLFQVPRHPLALGRGLQQHARRGAAPQDGREPVPAGDDPLFDQLPLRGEDAELALAFVHIESYSIHGGWPSPFGASERV